MIYVSTACIKTQTIKEAINKLVSFGFKNIELSGGTKHYPGLEKDIEELQEKYGLSLICHNYFPPPENEFVLNLASLDESIREKSENHIKKSIDLSRKLGANKYAFHAGFFIDVSVREIGKIIPFKEQGERKKSFSLFIDSLKRLKEYSYDIELYIENNVISTSNYYNYKEKNPFLFVDYDTYIDIYNEVEVKPLLDVGHLKVSCNSLDRNFNLNLTMLNNKTDYIHISDNDGLHDLNNGVKKNSEFYNNLKEIDLRGKTITLEVYDGFNSIKNTFELIDVLV